MKNKTFGSALIVAGTTIGAGMIAMPLTSAEMGFGYTLLLLFILWALLSYSALLYVEVYQKAENADVGIGSLAETYFGMTGRVLATLSLVVFMYALLTAYTAGSGGDLLVPMFSFLGEHAKSAGIIIFTLIFGIFVTKGAGSVDTATRFLFIVKLLAFGFVLLMALPLLQIENLGAMPLDKWLILSASPVFFTAFGFHGSIPSINKYLDGDVKRLRIAIIGGTAIPLVVYILWQMTIHGVFAQTEFVSMVRHTPTLSGLVEAIHQATGSAYIGLAVKVFMAIALITSYLGVALALLDCIDDLLQRVNIKAGRISLGLLTFLPPLFFALFYTDFIKALTYAGQMFTFYGLVLPVGLVWRFRKVHPEASYRVIGGGLGLVLALVLGLLIINVPYFIQAGWLPEVLNP